MLIETDRLLIRDWQPPDALHVLDLMSRPEVTRWLGDGEPVLLEHLAEARVMIRIWRSKPAPLGWWAVQLRATGEVVGCVLLDHPPNADAGEVEVGCFLHPDAWGRGYGPEAIAAALDHGFAAGLTEILALHQPGNQASVSINRKLGMEHVGPVERWYSRPMELWLNRRP